jgi:hypothetical protein
MRAGTHTFRWPRSERGTTAATAALALGAFALGGALFGGAVLTGGYAGSEQLEETIYAAMHRSALGVELRGPVHLRTGGTTVTHILIDVGALPGSDGVPLDPAATDARTIVSYSDADVLVSDVPYAVHWLTGDGDALLEAGELAQIDVDATARITASA